MLTRPPERTPARAVAMVLLSEPLLPDAKHVVRTLAKRRQATLDHAGETVLAIDVEGEPSMVALVPTPVPWSQLGGPCSAAWWWRDAEQVCRKSNAHLIVMTSAASGDVFEANLRLTDIVAALASTSGALAVYWGSGTVVHEPTAFREEAAGASRELLPLRLWLDFRIVPTSPGQLFFATTGMKAFGLMELECVGAAEDADRFLDRLFNVAHYLCDKGPILKDGDTFGLNPNEKIRIRHRPSRWERDGDVIFLEFPS